MKNWRIYKKAKTALNNQRQYKIFKSKQLYGLLLVLLSSYFFIVSIVQVPGFTTIYSYTFGLLFGYYSYFIFAGFIYFGLSLLIDMDKKIEKFLVKKYNRAFHFSWIVYFFFVIGVALIIESSFFIHRRGPFPGGNVFFQTIKDWWDGGSIGFTSGNQATAVLPCTINSGFIPTIFISLIASWAGFPVTLVIGIIFFFYFWFYIYFGSLLKVIQNTKHDKSKLKKREIEEHKTKVLDLSFENENVLEKPSNLDNGQKFQKTVTLSIDNVNNSIFNIEDTNEENKNHEFIEEKTKEFNFDNNLLQDFNIEKDLEKDKKLSNPETFEFELNIFDTITAPIADNDIDSEIKK